jgi:hypothetical protein
MLLDKSKKRFTFGHLVAPENPGILKQQFDSGQLDCLGYDTL